MPIEDVRVCGEKSTVKTLSGHNADVNRLRGLISKEESERKAADADLQKQIDEKQPQIQIIEIFIPEGYFDFDTLNLLISNLSNKILYNKLYYTLMYKDNQYRRYQAPSIDPNILYTILVDVTNGHYIYSQIANAELQNHIANNERHINPGEREFWNNKLNYETDGEVLTFNRN